MLADDDRESIDAGITDSGIRLKVKRSPIRATIINKSGDAFVKYEMFKRLNTGGAMLSAQEIRNCSSRMVDGGDVFYDAIQDMAAYEPFVNSISRLPESFKEKRADEELVLRFFAVTTYRERYKGNIEEWLDEYMEDVLFKRAEFDPEEMRVDFEKVFSLIDGKMGSEAFTRFNEAGKPTGRLAPAYYEASVCAFSDNYEKLVSMPSYEVRERVMRAFSDPGFLSATGPGANTVPKLNDRISIVTRYLGE